MNTLQIGTEDNEDYAEKLSGLSTGDTVTLSSISGTVRENADGVFVLDVTGFEGASKADEEETDPEEEAEMDDGEEGVALEVIRGS